MKRKAATSCWRRPLSHGRSTLAIYPSTVSLDKGSRCRRSVLYFEYQLDAFGRMMAFITVPLNP